MLHAKKAQGFREPGAKNSSTSRKAICRRSRKALRPQNWRRGRRGIHYPNRSAQIGQILPIRKDVSILQNGCKWFHAACQYSNCRNMQRKRQGLIYYESEFARNDQCIWWLSFLEWIETQRFGFSQIFNFGLSWWLKSIRYCLPK